MKAILIDYTKADLAAAFNLHYAKKFPIRSKLLLFLGLFLFVLGAVLFFIPIDRLGNMKWIFFLVGLFYIGFYFYRKNSLINMALKNPTIKDMEKLAFTEKNIRFEGKKGFFEQDWDKFEEIHQDEDSTLLYSSKHNFFIIPSRILNDDEKNKLNNILKNKLK